MKRELKMGYETKEKILTLKPRESWFLLRSEGGGARVLYEDEVYLLFEIPQYGGTESLHDVYNRDQIDDLISTVKGWT